MSEGTVPEVYVALANILKSFSVEADGTLPASMSGGKYIRAVDLFNAVKVAFAQNDLVLLTNEHLSCANEVTLGAKLALHVIVSGEYTLVSTRDASSVSFSGVGEGFAFSNAVAANIASTYALKNALMRTLLASEDSVEKEGLTPADAKVAATLSKAKKRVEEGRIGTMGGGAIKSVAAEQFARNQSLIKAHFGGDLAKVKAAWGAYAKENGLGSWAKEANNPKAIQGWADTLGLGD